MMAKKNNVFPVRLPDWMAKRVDELAEAAELNGSIKDSTRSAYIRRALETQFAIDKKRNTNPGL